MTSVNQGATFMSHFGALFLPQVTGDKGVR